jgi:hypothetical protein
VFVLGWSATSFVTHETEEKGAWKVMLVRGQILVSRERKDLRCLSLYQRRSETEKNAVQGLSVHEAPEREKHGVC